MPCPLRLLLGIPQSWGPAGLCSFKPGSGQPPPLGGVGLARSAGARGRVGGGGPFLSVAGPGSLGAGRGQPWGSPQPAGTRRSLESPASTPAFLGPQAQHMPAVVCRLQGAVPGLVMTSGLGASPWSQVEGRGCLSQDRCALATRLSVPRGSLRAAEPWSPRAYHPAALSPLRVLGASLRACRSAGPRAVPGPQGPGRLLRAQR